VIIGDRWIRAVVVLGRLFKTVDFNRIPDKTQRGFPSLHFDIFLQLSLKTLLLDIDARPVARTWTPPCTVHALEGESPQTAGDTLPRLIECLQRFRQDLLTLRTLRGSHSNLRKVYEEQERAEHPTFVLAQSGLLQKYFSSYSGCSS
jgi:hypothetical protein